MRTALCAAFVALSLAASGASAEIVLGASKGEVRIDAATGVQGQRISSGSTIILGPNSQATLKFDDDMQIVLNENTTFKIADFRYRAQEKGSDRAVFDLLRGALRFVTGIIGARSRNTVALRIPQATIGIRGTDFMVALVNPGFISVTKGAVSASNTAGTTVFGQGTIGQITSATSLGTPISASQLPAAASNAFSTLSAAPLAPGTTAGGPGGGATGAAAGGAGGTTAGVGAGVAIGAGAAMIGVATKSSGTTTHH